MLGRAANQRLNPIHRWISRHWLAILSLTIVLLAIFSLAIVSLTNFLLAIVSLAILLMAIHCLISIH